MKNTQKVIIKLNQIFLHQFFDRFVNDFNIKQTLRKNSFYLIKKLI